MFSVIEMQPFRFSRKYLGALVFLTAGLSLFFGPPVVAASPSPSTADPPFNVVATTSLLADFASHILGEEIASIIPPGVCPAHFDPSAVEVAALAGADLVLCHGFEGWLDNLLTSANNSGAKRAVTGMLGGVTWNVPTNAINLYVPKLVDIFSTQYPANASTFAANAATYKSAIQAAVNASQAAFNASENAHASVAVMSHQEYFARWLGLKIAVVWNASDEAMSAADIATVVEIARAQNVTIFISNNPSGTQVGADMAAEIGAAHVVLANFPGDENTTDYLSMIAQNIGRIQAAVPPSSKQNAIGIGIGPFVGLAAFALCIGGWKLQARTKRP